MSSSPPPPPPSSAAEDDFAARVLSTDWLVDEVFVWKNLILLAIVVVLFMSTKAMFIAPILIRKALVDKDALAKFTTLDDALVRDDNKALAIQLAGFVVGVGLVVRGSLSTQKADLGEQLLDFLVFTLVGLVLVGVSHAITDAAILRKINSVTEIVGDSQNRAVAVMVACLHVATGTVIAFSITEASNSSIGEQVGITCLWWAISMVLMVITGFIYEKLTFGYDDTEEIAKGNIAAALGYGMFYIALGILIASPISKADSITAVVLSWFVGTAIIFLLRFAIDFCVFPGRKLDKEIEEDQNWGAALIEGCATVAFALVFWNVYRVDNSEACVIDDADVDTE